MANYEVALTVKSSEVASGLDGDSESHPESGTATGKSSLQSRKKWPFCFTGSSQKWTKIFVASCVFAVLLDPLFLYVPVIDRDMNCLKLDLDQNLKITALILRSLTDVFYVVDIIVQIFTSDVLHVLHVLIDVLAILPLPQVLMLTMKESSFLYTRKFAVNFFVLVQYIPRVLRIYLSCKRETPSGEPKRGTPLWVKGVLNFFLYILASHVLGALWYFFAIERLTTCWQSACGRENGCDSSAFGCQDATTTSLDVSCPIISPDPTVFDFGIFLSVLQSGVPWSTNFAQKFTNCFCWGLRNLSAFGSNLQPSANTWENLFVVFISIIGLLLFVYLIGNLQTYLSLDTARIESYRFDKELKEKMDEVELRLPKNGIPKKLSDDIKPQIMDKAKHEFVEGRNVNLDNILSLLSPDLEKKTKSFMKLNRKMELWFPKNGIPEKLSKDIKPQIMERVEQGFVEGRNVNLDNIPSLLTQELQKEIKSYMPLTKLKKVAGLQNMEEKVLNAICRHLNPKKYTKNAVIIQEDKPLQTVVIVDGEISIEKKGASVPNKGAGEVCGQELLTWPFSPSFPRTLPTATESVRAIGDVEALVLTASNMKSVANAFPVHFNKKYDKLKENLIDHATPADPTPASFQPAPTISVETIPARPKVFMEQELKKATDNFDRKNIIGEGAYGIVYKGRLPDNTVVAIKKPKGGYRSESAVNEALVLSQIRHRNVVKLLGCCFESQMPLMVYEFINNGTLYQKIHHHQKGGGGYPRLSLEMRMKIAAETSGALAHLHSMSIVHRDVEATNILLDERNTPKLSDFGCSKLLHEDEDEDEVFQVSTLAGRGTLGYLDPEYLHTRKLTEKSDVYSFGVVLMELLTSRTATSVPGSPLAHDFVCSLKDGRLDQILDGEMLREASSETIRKVSRLAMRCVEFKGEERPSMKEVATELDSIRQTSFAPSPKETDHYSLWPPSIAR